MVIYLFTGKVSCALWWYPCSRVKSHVHRVVYLFAGKMSCALWWYPFSQVKCHLLYGGIPAHR